MIEKSIDISEGFKLDYTFDVEEEVSKTIEYLRNYGKKYVIGISGGKDSTVAAKLAALAVGSKNVVGLIMPNGEQKDINDAIKACEVIGIKYYIVNIKNTVDALEKALDESTGTVANYVSNTNDPACIRTNMLLALSRRIGGMMINTCNRTEDVLGYSTFGGDSMGSVGPLCKYTVTEVLEIGDYLGLPHELVHKAPSDGMCGSTDEENLAKILGIPGFTYARIDKLIRFEPHDFTKDQVDSIINQFNKNKFKIEIIQVKHQPVDLPDFFEIQLELSKLYNS